MIPISVLTWRLGKVNTEKMEALILDKNVLVKALEQFSHDFTRVFYLSTCQRVILVTDTSDESLTFNVYHKFLRAIGQNPKNFIKPEIFSGIDALHHLAMVISSLDSIVIGEVQIQGQFKSAFNFQKKYLGKTLTHVLSMVIRTGKRVRDRSLLKNTKISTISLVEEILRNELDTAKSIGIVGTGEMGVSVINFLCQKYSKLTIYTRTESRIGEKIDNLIIQDYNKLQTHDVLILASSASVPFLNKSILKKVIDNKITIVDLGLPRNCDIQVTELKSVSLISMEDLVIYSKNNLNNSTLESAYNILEEEITNIINSYRKNCKAKAVISLRKEIMQAANDRKADFNLNGSKESKKFDQFINQLIHISQRHIENILFEKQDISFIHN